MVFAIDKTMFFFYICICDCETFNNGEIKTMTITTAQKNQIINWVNSNEFKPVLNEIIEFCLTSTDTYFHLRKQGIDNKNLLKAEAIVFGYILTYKIPVLNRPSIKNDTEAKKYAEAKNFLTKEIMKKYGSILEKNINERFKMNGIKKDF
jgi:tRNA A22 N-methylase